MGAGCGGGGAIGVTGAAAGPAAGAGGRVPSSLSWSYMATWGAAGAAGAASSARGAPDAGAERRGFSPKVPPGPGMMGSMGSLPPSLTAAGSGPRSMSKGARGWLTAADCSGDSGL